MKLPAGGVMLMFKKLEICRHIGFLIFAAELLVL